MKAILKINYTHLFKILSNYRTVKTNKNSVKYFTQTIYNYSPMPRPWKLCEFFSLLLEGWIIDYNLYQDDYNVFDAV